jgi:small conductance mechanosensitive channel
MDTALVHNATSWLVNNQSLIIQYAVNLTAALITLIIGWIFARLVTNGFARVMRVRHIDPTITDFISNMLKYAILAFVVIAALSRIGVQTASFVAVIGAAGLAVGLALQGSLSNFAAGVLIIMFRPIRAGEYVEIAGVGGTVQSVQIFSTILTSADNKMIIVPNGSILNGTIVNYSRMPERRVDMTFGISYDSDLKRAKDILIELIQADPRVLKDRDATVAVAALADSSVNLVARAWVNNSDYWGVFYDLQEKVKLAFDEAGIDIPYPQMALHMTRQ